MKKQSLTILIAVLILLVIIGAVFVRARMHQEAALSSPEPTVAPASTDTSNLQNNSQLSPEDFRDQVLLPILSYHPGTAGSSLAAASASASVLDFAAANQLRFADQEDVNRLLKEAIALLPEDEQGLLPESASGVISLIGSTLSDYEGNKGVYEDSGTADQVLAALNHPGAAEDWAKLKAAFDVCLPAGDSVS